MVNRAWRIPIVTLALFLAGCADEGAADGGRANAFPQAEIWIGSSTVPEEEPLEVGDGVPVDFTIVIRPSQEPDWEAERRARVTWTSRDPAVATVDSLGRVTAVAPGRATIVAALDPATLPAYAPPPEGDSTYVRVRPVDPARASLRFHAVSLARTELRAANCASTMEGATHCWGTDLDNAEEVSRMRPVRGRFTRLTQGFQHACGITPGGAAACWGEGGWGQLGTGSTRAARVPAPVAGGGTFTRISAGGHRTCAIDAAGALYCWGSNLGGGLGTRAQDRCSFTTWADHRRRREWAECALRPTAVLPGHRFRDVAAGDGHTCALEQAGAVLCWGDDFDQQVPRGGGTPARVETGVRFTALWAGSRHTCGITAAGQAWCWGRNWMGQLGVADPQRSRTPVRVPLDVRFASLAPGDEHTCGVAVDGAAYCWGDNGAGQLGVGALDGRSPRAVAGRLRFRQVAAGRRHTCGVTLRGGLFCWGSGLEFDLPGGTLSDRREPVRVAGPQPTRENDASDQGSR